MTTTGIEPLFAVAYKRRYLTDGTKWKYEYVIDTTADQLIKEYGIDPSRIETAYGLAHDYEKRLKFQADIQDYVDMSISSTINLPSWGSKGNSESDVSRFAQVLSNYAPRLRGFTCYPDGSRGGQPLTEVDYYEAIKHKGVTFEENIDRACTSGVCGLQMYKRLLGISFITGVSIGLEFVHLTKNLITIALDLGIIRIMYVQQKIAS